MGKEENPAQLCPGADGARSNTCYENAWASEATGKLTHTLPLDVFEPADGKLPLTPAAAAIKEEYKKSQGDPSLLRHIDTQTRCLHSGVPRSNFAIGYVGYQIIQGAGRCDLYRRTTTSSVSSRWTVGHTSDPRSLSLAGTRSAGGKDRR